MVAQSFLWQTASAAQTFNLQSPTAFFTNFASQLLRSKLSLELNRIQIYPTNQYSPAVHQILQLTANIYDAATNRSATTYPFLPTVFRPLFTNENGTVYINDYVEETGLDVLAAPMRDAGIAADRSALQATDMIYGIPIIIGARKGFPSFNEFALLNDLRVSRDLTFHRSAPYGQIIETNQIYSLSISNALGVEAWNSYGTTLPRELQMSAAVDVLCSVTSGTDSNTYVLGRDGNPLFATSSFNSTLLISNWPGFSALPSASSFVIPLSTNYLFLTNSHYSFSSNQFVSPGTNTDDPPNVFPLPGWRVHLATRVRFALIDTLTGRIVDYVNLSSARAALDFQVAIDDALQTGASCNGSSFISAADLFCTNRLGPLPDDIHAMTYGLRNQFQISLGNIGVSDIFWHAFNAQVNEKTVSIQQFHDRIFGLDALQQNFAAPFSPTRVIHQNVSWQVNDPLVHYTVSDLQDLLGTTKAITFDDNDTSSPFQDFGGRSPLNAHYRPWGGNPGTIAETVPATKSNLFLKDPMVRRSDDWRFPTNGYPSLEWLGAVHRGTPWQTLFLKPPSGNPSFDLAWSKWIGVTNAAEAKAQQPTNDWHTISLILTLLNETDPHALRSLNPPGIADWQTAMDGLYAETNSGAVIVISSNSPQAMTIANALHSQQSGSPLGYFRETGDILAVPELTLASPFLNVTGVSALSITDEAYEKIPSQLLPFLRPDSIGEILQAVGGMEIRFSGLEGYPYRIEVSSNLTEWIAVATNTPSNGVFTFLDSPAPAAPAARFYRCFLLP